MLFGVLVYLLRLLLINGFTTKKSILLGLVGVLFGILLLAYSVSQPYALPLSKVYALLELDLALIILFIVSGFSSKYLNEKLLNNQLSVSIKEVYAGFFRLTEQFRDNVIFVMIYLLQAIAIWNPVYFS